MANELIWLSQASQAIAKVATLGEAKEIADKAAAIRVFADRQDWSREQRAFISEIEIRSVVKMGDILKKMPKATGKKGRFTGGSRKEPPADEPTLADIGITKERSHLAQKLSGLPKRELEAYIAKNRETDKLTVTGVARLVKERERESKREQDRQAVATAEKPEVIVGVNPGRNGAT